jgi:hypothetical protein
MKVPRHCVEFFKNKFDTFPSFIGVDFDLDVISIDKITKKSKLIWLDKVISKDNNKENEKLIEYDSTGIMIYIKDSNCLTFLTTSDKIQNVELILSQLKRIKK